MIRVCPPSNRAAPGAYVSTNARNILFQGVNGHGLICLDKRIHITPKNSVLNRTILEATSHAHDALTKSFLLYIDCFVGCMSCRAVMLESKVVQFRHKKVINYSFKALPIACSFLKTF